MVIVNSPLYGGSGGAVATFSTHSAAVEIALHEMGHTAFGFADEYEYYAGCWTGETGRNVYPGGEPFEPNVTANADPRHDQVAPGADGAGRCAADDEQRQLRAMRHATQSQARRLRRRLCRCALLPLRRLPPELHLPDARAGQSVLRVCRKVIRDTLTPYLPAAYQGLWWNAPAGSESGWGINIAHQEDLIFATWFTYNAAGKPWWLVMTAAKGAGASYSGTLYETRGPAFNATPFNPALVIDTPSGRER